MLTPMDLYDLEFPRDLSGNILLTLVERNGQRISAFSASDGTLRFLAFIVALLEDQPARVYFFEEIENGIHLEQRVYNGGPQVIISIHSPQLLRFVSPKTLEFTSMTYRLPDQPDTRIKRILDIPDAKRVIDDENLSRIHESGWLEDAVYFTEGDDL